MPQTEEAQAILALQEANAEAGTEAAADEDEE